MAVKMKPTFEVDKAGLAKQLARKGKSFAVVELIQNAWDEDTTTVHVTLEPQADGMVKLVVEDDNPEGFADLTHAYTLFAESKKKGDPLKRGRFNLGEKLVIAICEKASIVTTKGSVMFTEKGRVETDKGRDKGSVFTGIMPMSDAERAEVEDVILTLIPPAGITTTFNMTPLVERKPERTFTATLRTERSDEDGNLKPTNRKTTVEVYKPLKGETAMLYELGIPVVETGDAFHVNIGQKIPLNMDRDNVTPTYLREIRALVLNATHDMIVGDDMKAAWITKALEHEKIDPAAVQSVITSRFGEKVVISDPSDPEANKIAMEQGYTVIPGGALSQEAWGNVKGGGIVLPAGKVTPSPKPDDDGLALMNPDHWPADVERVAGFAEALAKRLLGVSTIEVRVTKDNSFAATYGPRKGGTEGVLTFYVGSLGFKWFRRENAQAQMDLLIHEFGHHFCSDHLDRKYLNALSKLGAQTAMIALHDPAFFCDLVSEAAITALAEAAA